MPDSRLQDPMGRTIVLHDRTWFGHILKRHPDMARRRRAVHEAIGDPQQIVISASDADCRLYFGAPNKAGIMVVVVADVVVGVVLTAYRTGRVKGAIEWSRPIH